MPRAHGRSRPRVRTRAHACARVRTRAQGVGGTFVTFRDTPSGLAEPTRVARRGPDGGSARPGTSDGMALPRRPTQNAAVSPCANPSRVTPARFTVASVSANAP